MIQEKISNFCATYLEEIVSYIIILAYFLQGFQIYYKQ